MEVFVLATCLHFAPGLPPHLAGKDSCFPQQRMMYRTMEDCKSVIDPMNKAAGLENKSGLAVHQDYACLRATYTPTLKIESN